MRIYLLDNVTWHVVIIVLVRYTIPGEKVAFDCLSACRPERCFIPVQFLFLPPSAYVESLHLLISVLQRQLLLFVSGALFISMMLLLSGNKHGLHEEGDSLTLAEDSLETSSLIFPEKQ